MYEGDEHLGLLVKDCEHSYDKHGLGFSGNTTHSTSKSKTDYFVRSKGKIYNHAWIRCIMGT